MKIEDLPLAAFHGRDADWHARDLKLFRDQTLDRLVHALDGVGDEWDREESQLRAWGAEEEYVADSRADFFLSAIHANQEVLNLLAVGLYHVFEKQVVAFTRSASRFRRELIGRDKQVPNSLGASKRRLKAIALDCEKFHCWPTINDVLRNVANTVKHGEGPSFEELGSLKEKGEVDPELFRNPSIAHKDPSDSEGGDFDIYVQKHHLDDWSDAVINFWREMGQLAWSQEERTLGSPCGPRGSSV